MAISRSALLVVALVIVPLGSAPFAGQHHHPGWQWYGSKGRALASRH
jgi:hypothetical protein